jgi:branched-subunit amino acid aminotransferase/4-amino-4-deoxychorismate lyase
LNVGEGMAIASASPERFLQLTPEGHVSTRPIKGTRPRGRTPEEDLRLARDLLASEKDRAENLMIVDLLRNDLSRVSRLGSVEVSELAVLESFANVHHLVSEIRGTLFPNLGPVDLLRATFPGGSITGAPKIRAMEIINELEPARRGPYCGAIAWIGFDGAMDSSIVIRTLVVKDGLVAAQAGGGIVADSDPAAEYDEAMDKAWAKVYLDGNLMAASDARIDPADRGLTLGDGLFETIAVRGGQAARLGAHLARLGDGARVLGINVPYGADQLTAAMADVIEANDITEGVLRLTLTRGPGPRGLLPPDPSQPSLLITGSSQELAAAEPATAIIAATTRRNEQSLLSGVKATSNLDNVLAAREAREKGAHEALLLNGAGNLAEAASANLFLVLGGQAVTPPQSDGALPGVMRRDVIGKLEAAERTLRLDDLKSATEAFLTNSLRIRPLVAVGDTPIGDGNPGPVTSEAQKIV